MTSNKQHWSYLAGIIDGEGCISISDTRKNTYTKFDVNFNVTNTSLPLMKWLIEHFGGVYYTKGYNGQSSHKPHWRTSYNWRPKGRRNREILLLGVLPYLVIKKEQAKLLLEYVQMDGENDPEKRRHLAQRCRALNQPNVSVTTNTPDTAEAVMIESDLIGDYESAPPVMAVA